MIAQHKCTSFHGESDGTNVQKNFWFKHCETISLCSYQDYMHFELWCCSNRIWLIQCIVCLMHSVLMIPMILDFKKWTQFRSEFSDDNYGIVLQKFLDLCLTEGENARKAEDIFNLVIDETLSLRKIPWINCIAFGLDNTNTNIGAKNSIKSRTLQKNPTIFCSWLTMPYHS